MDNLESVKITEIVEEYKWSPLRSKMTFDSFKPENDRQKTIKKFILEFPKEWYVLYGDVGTGKTHLSTALIKKRIDEDQATFEIIKFRFIGAEVRQDFSKEVSVINRFSKPDILVIEEIGKGYNTDFERELLFEIMDQRLEYEKQTILITNLSKEKFLSFIGKPTGDRITSVANFIHFNWKSYRQKEKADE